MSSNLAKVQDVDIDPNGVFKYIQVEVKDSDGGAKRIVRGYGWAEYHGASHLIALVAGCAALRGSLHSTCGPGCRPASLQWVESVHVWFEALYQKTVIAYNCNYCAINLI